MAMPVLPWPASAVWRCFGAGSDAVVYVVLQLYRSVHCSAGSKGKCWRSTPA